MVCQKRTGAQLTIAPLNVQHHSLKVVRRAQRCYWTEHHTLKKVVMPKRKLFSEVCSDKDKSFTINSSNKVLETFKYFEWARFLCCWNEKCSNSWNLPNFNIISNDELIDIWPLFHVVIDKKTQFASDRKQKIQQIQLMRERNPIANHFVEQD